VNGSSTVAGQTVDVDASFLDLVEDSESILALMGYFEARRGPLAFYTDLVWSSLSFAGERSATGPLGGVNVSADAELDYEQTIIEAGISYEIARFSGDAVSLKDNWGSPTSYTAIDVLAGARYWRESLGISLDITGAGPGVLPPGFQASGNRVVARSGDMEWVDPVVGLRVRHQFSPGQELRLRGDIGGFGMAVISPGSSSAATVLHWATVGAASSATARLPSTLAKRLQTEREASIFSSTALSLV
jgi:hypothetical protein